MAFEYNYTYFSQNKWIDRRERCGTYLRKAWTLLQNVYCFQSAHIFPLQLKKATVLANSSCFSFIFNSIDVSLQSPVFFRLVLHLSLFILSFHISNFPFINTLSLPE